MTLCGQGTKWVRSVMIEQFMTFFQDTKGKQILAGLALSKRENTPTKETERVKEMVRTKKE